MLALNKGGEKRAARKVLAAIQSTSGGKRLNWDRMNRIYKMAPIPGHSVYFVHAV